MYCGSRSMWKKDDEKNVWSQCLKKYPQITEFCRTFPDHILFGEIYGWIQHLRYGHHQNEFSFAAFDVLYNGSFWNAAQVPRVYEMDVPVVPHLKTIKFDLDQVITLSNGPSTIYPKHCREGVVVETLDRSLKMKCVGSDYLIES